VSDQATNSCKRAAVRISIGVLLGMVAIHIQSSDDIATLAGRAFACILLGALSLFLIASGITKATEAQLK
jgi:hypothetical protein